MYLIQVLWSVIIYLSSLIKFQSPESLEFGTRFYIYNQSNIVMFLSYSLFYNCNSV